MSEIASAALEIFLSACKEMDRLDQKEYENFWDTRILVRNLSANNPAHHPFFAQRMGITFVKEHPKLICYINQAFNIMEAFDKSCLVLKAAQAAYNKMRLDFLATFPYDDEELNGPAWQSINHEYSMELSESNLGVNVTGELKAEQRWW